MPTKLVLLVRTDLDMGRGKIAAQAAHAAVSAVLRAMGRSRRDAQLVAWLQEGQPKVVLRVASADELADVCDAAQEAGLPVEVIEDAGRTQVAPGTATCAALGPAAIEPLDAVTGQLRLL